MDIRKTIRSFIEQKAILKKEKLGFSDDDNFFALQLVSSLFAMELVTHIEKTYAVTFEDDDLDVANFSSISAIVSFLDRKGVANASA